MALIKCPDCGREVSSRAVSCPNCGCPVAEIVASEGMPPAAQPVNRGESPEERQLILAHLNDLRTLELLNWKYNKPMVKAAARYGIDRYSSPDDLIRKIQDKISSAIIPVVTRAYSMTLLQFSNAIKEQSGPISLIYVDADGKHISLPSYLYNSNGDFDWKVVFNGISDYFETSFNANKENRIKVMVALKMAYDANIIPAPFRNLQGVYYLYDYLSTSNESLSNALLHLDLDIIKTKLDTVINQQGEILLQTCIANLQMASMQQKFDQLLETVQSISQDAAAIARYSAISAAHLETIKILEFIN